MGSGTNQSTARWETTECGKSNAPAKNWRMKKPKRGVRSMDPNSGGTRPENSFR
jgi:hypothetical protein